MQYSNYDMKNNVHATLSTAVSSVATTIQLTSGQGSRFGTTFPQIATLESFDENGKVIKREIVKITGRSGDNLTVVRAFAPCPENDDANSQTQNAISFNADDTISLYIPKEIFDKISDSLNDIYDNGTNNLRTESVSGLEVEVNAGSVLVGSSYYDFAGGTITLTDNATNYLEIDEDGNLANNTTGRNDENAKLAIITTSGGSVTNIKDRRLGTIGGKIGGVNIHDLTEKEILDPDDEFIISDSEAIRQNKKVKMSSIIGYKKAICTETIQKGDIVCFGNMFFKTSSSINVGNATSNTKISQKIYGNGLSSNNIDLILGISGSGQNMTITIETDNNGSPSGTLVDGNATATVLASSLSSTLTTTNIVFGGNFTLTKGVAYWIVVSTPNINASNYGLVGNIESIGNSLLYNGSVWTLPTSSKSETQPDRGTSSGSGTQWNMYFQPNKDIILTKLTFSYATNSPVITFTDITTSEQIHSGRMTNVYLQLTAGHVYRWTFNQSTSISHGNITEANKQTIGFGHFWGNYISSSYGTSVRPKRERLEFEKGKIIAHGGDFFNQNIIGKVDTSLSYSFSDNIGVALEDGSDGDNINVAMNGGIVENENRNLIPGQDYFFVNNSISETTNINDTKIYLGKAISKIGLSLDIKLFLRILNTDTVAPFSGLLIQQTSYGSWSAYQVDGSSRFLSCCIRRGQILNGFSADANYSICLTKNR